MIKVLVVEDNESIRKSIAKELELEKFSVFEAVDGEEAVTKTISEKPDVILLDIILPKISGLEALKKIRANASVANTKVIVFTNLDADEKMISEITALNPSFYINKGNLHLKDLPQKIRECVES
jgi:DNA-binding response OmpR family regulator